MNLEQPCIRISVRNLVEFILRHGDIDNRTGGADKDAMQQGSRIHRKIQRQQGAEYRAEVPLRYQIPCDGFILSVEGRADGIIELPKRVVVDEIKGVFKDLKRLEEPQLLHLAQAKCYAYIYAEQNNLEEIGVQMTYCNLDTEEIRRFRETYTRAELKKWFEKLVAEYEKWARYQMTWRAKRNASIKTVEFPFEYRDGQKKLVESVYRTILRKKKLFIQAPTGVGKTMAAVFPAVKAVGEELGEKIFYLTAKTIMRTVAEQAFSLLLAQCDVVAARMRKDGKKCSCVSVTYRMLDFRTRSHQKKLENPTDVTEEIFAQIKNLLRECWQCQPLRLIGVALTDLTSDDFRQMSLFENTENHEKQKKVDGVVDDIRKRFGNGMIVRGSTMKTADKVARKAKAQMDLH